MAPALEVGGVRGEPVVVTPAGVPWTLKTTTVRSAAQTRGRSLFTTPERSVPSAVIVTVTSASPPRDVACASTGTSARPHATSAEDAATSARMVCPSGATSPLLMGGPRPVTCPGT